MTLATHALVGAAAAQFVPAHPFAAFLLGFGSHFAMDAIPHWDYKVFSYRAHNDSLQSDMDLQDPRFFLDLARIGLDFLIGIALSLFLFPAALTPLAVTLAGALGGVVPDPLQFAYWKIRREPLRSLQRFHKWAHAKTRLQRPLSGLVFQMSIILALTISAHILGRHPAIALAKLLLATS